MASSFIVIATDLRRVTAKAPAGGYMIDVLEDACAKLKLDSENYQLKSNNKLITLTDPVRAAGLAQGAKLELVVKSKSPAAVTVALRLPPSEARLGIPNNRVAAKVRNDTPVWKLLRHLEEEPAAKQKGLNLTARGVPRTNNSTSANTPTLGGAGQLYWEAPVLKFAGRELVTVDDFRKTLSRAGIDAGSQLVHLEFRVTEYTLQDAVETVHRQFEREDAEGGGAVAGAAPEPAASEPAVPEPAVPEPAIPEPAAAEPATPAAPPPLPSATSGPTPPEPMALDTAPLQPVQVWSPPKAGAGMPAAASLRWARESATSASGLAPTVAQMKAHQKHLEEAGRNKRLKSDAELEEETRAREARLTAVDKVDVRIRFPDGYTVLWSFPNGATGATLHAAVRAVLTEEALQEPFRLVPPMSRDEIHDQATARHDLVRGYGMRGGVAVNFLRGSSSSISASSASGRPTRPQYVRMDMAARAQDIVVPQLEADDEADDERARQAEAAAAAAAEAATQRKAQQGDATKKLSKFLRLAKK